MSRLINCPASMTAVIRSKKKKAPLLSADTHRNGEGERGMVWYGITDTALISLSVSANQVGRQEG